MTAVFCPNPACPRGSIGTGASRPARPIAKCPDCGRSTRTEPEDLDSRRGPEYAYRRFSADCYEAAWSGSRR